MSLHKIPLWLTAESRQSHHVKSDIEVLEYVCISRGQRLAEAQNEGRDSGGKACSAKLTTSVGCSWW